MSSIPGGPGPSMPSGGSAPLPGASAAGRPASGPAPRGPASGSSGVPPPAGTVPPPPSSGGGVGGTPADDSPPETPARRGGWGRRIGIGAIAIAAMVGMYKGCPAVYNGLQNSSRDGYVSQEAYNSAVDGCQSDLALQYAINGAENTIYSRAGSAFSENDLSAVNASAPANLKGAMAAIDLDQVLNSDRFKAAQVRDAKLEACVTPAKKAAFAYTNETRAALLDGYKQAADGCLSSFSYTLHSGEFASHIVGALKQGGYAVAAQAIVDANGGDAANLIAGKSLTIPVVLSADCAPGAAAVAASGASGVSLEDCLTGKGVVLSVVSQKANAFDNTVDALTAANGSADRTLASLSDGGWKEKRVTKVQAEYVSQRDSLAALGTNATELRGVLDHMRDCMTEHAFASYAPAQSILAALGEYRVAKDNVNADLSSVNGLMGLDAKARKQEARAYFRDHREVIRAGDKSERQARKAKHQSVRETKRAEPKTTHEADRTAKRDARAGVVVDHDGEKPLAVVGTYSSLLDEIGLNRKFKKNPTPISAYLSGHAIGDIPVLNVPDKKIAISEIAGKHTFHLYDVRVVENGGAISIGRSNEVLFNGAKENDKGDQTLDARVDARKRIDLDFDRRSGEKTKGQPGFVRVVEDAEIPHLKELTVDGNTVAFLSVGRGIHPWQIAAKYGAAFLAGNALAGGGGASAVAPPGIPGPGNGTGTLL